MIVLGIDPGATGALAWYEEGEVRVVPTPSMAARSRGREIDWGALVCEIAFAPADHAFIEYVSAMPGQGVSSMFKFGQAFGGVRALMAAYSIPVTLVTPPVWKKAMGLSGGKDASRMRASELFPAQAGLFKRKKDDGAAEAALIAYYGHQKLKGLKL